MAGTPWFFNNHLLLLHKIQPREDSMLVPLLSAEFWVQVHENQSEVGCEHFHPFKNHCWDISLCAVTRRRTAPVSRWLGEVDGPVCRNFDKKSGDNGHNGGNDRDIRWIWKDDLERLYLNLNYIPLGPRIEALNYEHVNQQNMGCEVDNRASNVSRPIDLILEWENDPLHTMDEQSRAMKILSWNIRRLGKLWIINCLKNKLRVISPQILFLMETKLSMKQMEAVRRKCGFGNGIDVGAIGSK
ncbi:hypothetical protein Goarm_001126 [Gossypium armourianum]|uniref:Uncharacterized protein n=1 Tax=Gossypium armourianum TaxID=34283 RepID=A0A7J9KC18_9ROSI|nr:hypothetical protein [Gossypium armourianum]